MSRTDSTDPLIVRIWHSPHRVEVHDHADGSCDLPARPLGPGPIETTRCSWDVAWRARHVCFCLHQHHAWLWRDEMRRQRRRTSARLRDALRQANAGDRDADVPLLTVRR